MSNIVKARKRPIEVDAKQYVRGECTKREWLEFCPSANIGTTGADHDASMDEKHFFWFVIETLEGDMGVTDGDWVIRGVNGEFYPCKPDIFAQTYDILEAT